MGARLFCSRKFDYRLFIRPCPPRGRGVLYTLQDFFFQAPVDGEREREKKGERSGAILTPRVFLFIFRLSSLGLSGIFFFLFLFFFLPFIEANANSSFLWTFFSFDISSLFHRVYIIPTPPQPAAGTALFWIVSPIGLNLVGVVCKQICTSNRSPK